MNSVESFDFPVATTLRECIRTVNVPLVFKNKIKSWKIPWTVLEWAEKYGEILLDYRLVPKEKIEITWEGEAQFVEATISQFFEWKMSKDSEDGKNPLQKFPKNKYWAYSSYNYMKQIFCSDPDILKCVNWDCFGFPEVSGSESTFWLGSDGAYTPCHVDTYGYNLVAQVLGRKKWILFPPDDTALMYPTRIPYEESSIFSSVNILNPDLITHPLFKESHPHSIILEPGDVLYVPKKWWHFVVSLDDTTASINTWIKLDSDVDARLEESMVKGLMSSLISYYEPMGETWLNPKEEITPADESISYILASLIKLSKKEVQEDSDYKPSLKTQKMNPSDHNRTSMMTLDELLKYRDVLLVPNDKQPLSKTAGTKTNQPTLKKIMNCFVHPDVVSVMCRVLKES